MKQKVLSLIFAELILVSAFVKTVSAQTFSLEIKCKNLPQNTVILGEVKGDKFTPLDSLNTKSNSLKFNVKESLHPGIYRVIFGQTLYAKIMNETPQQLDFIFNNEDIILETDFNAPEDSLLIILSEENRVWFEFQKNEKKLQNEMDELKMEIDYYQQAGTPEKATEQIQKYNEIQTERSQLIQNTIEKNSNLWAARLIATFHEPFLDGNLSAKARKEIFRNESLKMIDFSDESLIWSQVYTDKVFRYLVSFNQKDFTQKQREETYKKAVDSIVASTNKNQKVYEFILDYLVNGFEILKMNNLIEYMADKYSETTCQTDEKTTLERKLLSQKMKPGTEVPDFTMDDINGDPVTLSEVLKEKSLLIFWASWCPHCKEMLPFIQSWVKMQSSSFEVVAVSLDTDRQEWENAIKTLKTESWYNLTDLQEWDGKAATDYNIYATPSLFIIDKNRKIMATPVTINDLSKLNF